MCVICEAYLFLLSVICGRESLSMSLAIEQYVFMNVSYMRHIWGISAAHKCHI
jgi:hypothetical protein